MKRVFLVLALSVLALTSCADIEVVNTVEDMKSINFNAFSHNSTKGQLMTFENFKQFRVYSFRNGASSSSLYIDTEVTGNLSAYSTLSEWSTQGTYYWPLSCTEKGGKTESLSFYAVYPTNLTFNSTSKSVEYSVPAEIDNQIDLLAAGKTEMHYATTVDLEFGHILTNVGFQMNLDTKVTNRQRYTIINLTISNLENSGVYNFTEWTNREGNASYAINDIKVVEADNTIYGSPMLLMPQVKENSVKISVTYKAEVENGHAGSGLWVETYEGTKEVVVENLEWKAGQKVVYRISLTADAQPIKYRASLEDWNNGASNIVGL